MVECSAKTNSYLPAPREDNAEGKSTMHANSVVYGADHIITSAPHE